MTHKTIISPSEIMGDNGRINRLNRCLRTVTPKARDVRPVDMTGRHIRDRLHCANLVAHQTVVATGQVVWDCSRSHHLCDRDCHEKTHQENRSGWRDETSIVHLLCSWFIDFL
jgi:hypothetical protein